MTVGALIASRSGSTLGASYLLAGMAIIQLAAAAVGPIGVVLLPRMSEMGALGQRETLKRMTSALVYVMLAVGLIGTPLALAGTEDLVRAWLGAEFIPAFSVVRVISLALPPVVAWTLMASIADSTIRSPITGIASLVDFGVVLAGSVLGASYGPMALAWAFVAGRWVGAAILTAVVVRRHHPRVAVVRLCALGATVTLLCVALGMLLPASGNGAPLLALRLAAWIGLGMVAALAAAQVAPSALGLPRPFAPRKVAPHGLS
jgi:O-antigen/teichoic acid export membrane protein